VSRTPIRVVLEIDPDSNPVQGRFCAPGEPDRPFSGWLALAEAITAIHASRPPADVAVPTELPP
jgi:hypothetical protein